MLIREPARAGRYFLMISLGAIFGTTVMGRFSLLIARLDYLLGAFAHVSTLVRSRGVTFTRESRHEVRGFGIMGCPSLLFLTSHVSFSLLQPYHARFPAELFQAGLVILRGHLLGPFAGEGDDDAFHGIGAEGAPADFRGGAHQHGRAALAQLRPTSSAVVVLVRIIFPSNRGGI